MGELMLQVRRVASLEVIGAAPARRGFAVATFTLLTALGAQVSVPIGPVPVSLQTLFVSLAGLLLGARLGAYSQLAYLALGAAGLPVFAQGAGLGYLLGPTGGYLLAFPVAAAFTGWFAQRFGSIGGVRGAVVLGIGTLLGTGFVFLGGWSQLTALTGDPGRAFLVGVAPFLAGDVLKVVLAVLLAARLRRRMLRLL
ncbi:MAG TPA: biotin transporter BioY [Longimicrobiales bacterium]|nr:biotin transporter BioY [Longimicrobiales bacterium]